MNATEINLIKQLLKTAEIVSNPQNLQGCNTFALQGYLDTYFALIDRVESILKKYE